MTNEDVTLFSSSESSPVVAGNWSVTLMDVLGPSITITAQGTDDCGNIGSDSVMVPIYVPFIWFVKEGASGSGTGESWTDAFTVIQDAVDAASYGDMIWVAEGTYTNSPTSTASVLTMKDGVRIYGGFTGTERYLSEREAPAGHQTILDGEDTRYHVVVGASNARLDGFIVTGGNVARGGGMYNDSVVNLMVTNCTFKGNSASWLAGYGGGMYNDSVVNLMVTNCTFSGNSAFGLIGYGGGMYNIESSPKITNCIFIGNSASGEAGYGGGMYNNESSPEITNCTFSENLAGDYGGAIFNFGYSSPTVISNCIFWGDNAGVSGREFALFLSDNNDPSVLNISYSDVKRVWRSVYIEHGCTLNWGDGMIYDNPLFVGYPDVHLQAGSPCIDTGNEVVAPYEDLDGNSRPSGYGYDMGAYEFQFVADWYVNDNALPGGDGRSWDTAFNIIQLAVDSASYGDIIWVAEGTYTNSPTSTVSVLTMATGVEVYGGFTGTESDLSQRGDPAKHPTILDGEGESYHVVKGASFARLDGFIVKGGNARGFGSGRDGGGMYNYSIIDLLVANCTFSGNSAGDDGGGMHNIDSLLEVTNCTFKDNFADDNGGGMFNNNSSPEITDCTFSNNSASNDGGGMHNYSYSSPEIINCTFKGNFADDNGGGVFNNNSSPEVTDCTFSDNSASDSGGGIYNYNESLPKITNCIIIDNSASNDGGGMCNYGDSSPEIINCTFSKNSANDHGDGMYNFDSSPSITNCIMWGDGTLGGGDEINNSMNSNPSVTFSDIDQFGYAGSNNNIRRDPLFVTGPNGDYYLSQAAAGQGSDSPCVDTGSDTAENLGLDDRTTRTDCITDTGQVDMGYHYELDTTPPDNLMALPAGGSYCPTSVALGCNDPEAVIYYTLDGSEPTTGSPAYTGPIYISGDTILKFIAVDACGNQSAIMTDAYEIDDESPTGLTASPAGGSYCMTSFTVILSANDGSIYYTTDDTEPNTGSPIYVGPIEINANTTLKFISVDACGNISDIVTEIYTIRTVPPTISIISPSDGTILGLTDDNDPLTPDILETTVHISTDAEEGQVVTIKRGGIAYEGSVTAARTADILVDLFDCHNIITADVIDMCGNPAFPAVTNVTADLNIPSLNIVSPIWGEYFNLPVVVNGEYSDTCSGVSKITVEGVTAALKESPFSDSFSATLTALPEGALTIIATATDNGGNRADSLPVKTTVDLTSPTITITYPNQGNFVSAYPVVTGTVNDTLSGVSSVTVGGKQATLNLAENTFMVTLHDMEEGPLTIVARATDNAGNSADSAPVRVFVETEPPVIIITSPIEGEYVGKTVVVTGTVIDLGAGDISLMVNNETAEVKPDGSFRAILTELPEGPLTLRAIGSDRVGNTASSSVAVIVEISPPSLTISAPLDGQFIASVRVTVSGSVADLESGVAQVTVNGVAAMISGNGFIAEQVPLVSEGPTTVTAIASDFVGNQSSLIIAVYRDTIPPEMTITKPAHGSMIFTSTPLVSITYSDELSGVDTGGFGIFINDVDHTSLFTITPSEASYQIDPGNPLPEGPNTILTSIMDLSGNVVQKTAVFHIDLIPPLEKIVIAPGGVEPYPGDMGVHIFGDFGIGSAYNYHPGDEVTLPINVNLGPQTLICWVAGISFDDTVFLDPYDSLITANFVAGRALLGSGAPYYPATGIVNLSQITFTISETAPPGTYSIEFKPFRLAPFVKPPFEEDLHVNIPNNPISGEVLIVPQ